MYTPFIGDEKRDIVEYTSLGTSITDIYSILYTVTNLPFPPASRTLPTGLASPFVTPLSAPSSGFLGCPHTMLTYTRCMDSILCVPLMIDVAVWADYFNRCHAPQTRVGNAAA